MRKKRFTPDVQEDIDYVKRDIEGKKLGGYGYIPDIAWLFQTKNERSPIRDCNGNRCSIKGRRLG